MKVITPSPTKQVKEIMGACGLEDVKDDGNGFVTGMKEGQANSPTVLYYASYATTPPGSHHLISPYTPHRYNVDDPVEPGSWSSGPFTPKYTPSNRLVAQVPFHPSSFPQHGMMAFVYMCVCVV